ncbi:hypothetical protein IWQ62_001449 [Dispira parvispora]|uniref:Major facilitator superfamily (MFS) profile domain-containing protein n=1 Tax=Dispira parvispora TaxID=1520584 RepID=A0A9W8AYZ4_9FUNG|nr:hypothetical protein IWQ62_001449 [Dispira parvispora]
MSDSANSTLFPQDSRESSSLRSPVLVPKSGDDADSYLSSPDSTKYGRLPSLELEKKYDHQSLGNSKEVDSINHEDADDERPIVYTVFDKKTKFFIVLIVALAGLVAPLSSTMYLPAINIIQEEMSTTSVMMKLTVSLYLVGMAISPMVWGTLSDTLGRRPVYIVSFIIYIGACIGNALSNSIGLLLAMRLIQSLGSSSVIAVGAGSICDIYEARQRGTALGFFFMGALLGPVIGPIAGGYISEYLSWRWTFWILAIVGGLILALLTFCLPETHRRLVATKYKANMVDLPEVSSKLMVNPLLPLYYLKYLYIVIPMLNITVVYGGMYAMATAVPGDFARVYSLSTSDIGLTYIAGGIGNIIGSIAGGNFSDFMMRRYRKRKAEELEALVEQPETATEMETSSETKSTSTPAKGSVADANAAKLREMAIQAAIPKEQRLAGGLYFFWMLPTFLLLFGWLLEKNGSLVGVLAAQFLMGIGMTFTFASFSTYMVDIFTTRSATVTALNNSLRSLWAAVCSVIEDPMEQKIGVGWTFTFFSLLQFAAGMLIIILYIHGPRWRERWAPVAK